MKNFSIPLVCTLICASCGEKNKPHPLEYPTTKKIEKTETYFGETIPDPFQWLEDDKSPETAQWVKQENATTFGYLSQIPYREALKERIGKLLDYKKMGAPFSEGDYLYYFQNDGLQNQSVLYRKKKGTQQEELFLDPNQFSADGTTSLGTLSFTDDGSLLAYSISEGGSDWRKIIVLNAETRQVVGDTLKDVKFSSIVWKNNEGFFYSSYDKPQGSELSAKTDHHKLYFHKLGTPQKDDELIFGKNEQEKYRYVGAEVSKNGKYLFITAANATSGNKLFIKNLEKNTPIVTVLDDFSSDVNLIHTQNDFAYLLTNRNAPNGKLVKMDMNRPSPEHWQEIIPETQNVLSVSAAGGYFFASYVVDAISQVQQFDYNGKKIREVALPGIGTASGFSGKEKEQETFFYFTNYFTPTQIFQFDVQKGETQLYWQPQLQFNPEQYESVQVFYPSKDGTKIPMIITHKKGLKLNGENPTLLYGYGGFNIKLTPNFSAARAGAWLEAGGVYAVANLRGGGEYGKAWHDAGTKLQKQNVFDDFIAAAEFLIREKYTSSPKLAIQGGSNGGLLVGAVMTQRPELFGVALPAVGVLDMLRYHKFTAGAGWAYDYGTADDSPEMFQYLKGYSPIHNVKKGVCYPATLITTGDHDDRVVPAHSFKFAAELQEKQSCPHPVLIRIETNAGHGAGTPTSKIIEQSADIYAFTLWNMGFTQLPQ